MGTGLEQFQAHHCGRCGCWHQGSLCADQMTPQQPTNVTIVNPSLTEADVRRIVGEEIARAPQTEPKWPEDSMLEAAWGLIANAFGGNWNDASPEWREAAERWRDAYHDALRRTDHGEG